MKDEWPIRRRTERRATWVQWRGRPLPSGISDTVAQEYAMNYARMLQNRAKGIESSLPRIPHGLFEPNRNLIRSTLDRMSEKYFAWM